MDETGKSAEPALFGTAPQVRGRVAWLPLGRFPTPVEAFELDGLGRILVKRDDACADGYAGNKVRKLEFLLGAARTSGVRRLITAGAAGSHHALATAVHGRRTGFEVSLVLFPQPLTEHVREVLRMDLGTGAELRWTRRMEGVPFATLRARLAHRGEPCCVVPPGGSNEIGTLGYVSAGLELAGQVEAGAVERPGRVHVAAGTLGTAAGLAIGLAWAGLELTVVATRITSRLVTNERVLESLVRRTITLLHDAGASPPQPEAALALLELRHDQIGRGYGRATPACMAAESLFAAHGLRLDPTYTAKAAAGLVASMAEGPRGGGPPLFWQTLSSVEPRELLERVDVRDLPEPFASYAAGPLE